MLIERGDILPRYNYDFSNELHVKMKEFAHLERLTLQEAITLAIEKLVNEDDERRSKSNSENG